MWVNFARDEVKIIFEEGKKCEDVTEAPSGFKLDAQNCYVTDYVKLGGTSSLKFNQQGTYDYEVKAFGKEATEKGQIIVE